MNPWTEASVEFANQRNYLDELYKVYPITPNLRRELSEAKELEIKKAFIKKDNAALIKELLSLELFPLKDSYVAFLKRDKSAIERNPQTINRLAGNLYQMGYEEIIEKCTVPKETNRQIGPMFKNWLAKGVIGVKTLKNTEDFLICEENCIYCASDSEMQKFAKKYLGYKREKGLDFIAKFNNKYIIAEAKFITDFGGHQYGQFEDAISTLSTDCSEKIVPNEVIPIAILDGVLYIKSKEKMYRYLANNVNQIIISSLLLREFLFSL